MIFCGIPIEVGRSLEVMIVPKLRQIENYHY